MLERQREGIAKASVKAAVRAACRPFGDRLPSADLPQRRLEQAHPGCGISAEIWELQFPLRQRNIRIHRTRCSRGRRHAPHLAHFSGTHLQEPRRLSHTTAFIHCRRMRCTWNGVVLGLPQRLPDDRARSSPAITRSR